MSSYDVELAYGIGFSVHVDEAADEVAAVKKAKELIQKDVTIVAPSSSVCAGDLEFDMATFIQKTQKR